MSDALRKDIQSVYNRPIFVVPNVIETSRFRIAEKGRGKKLETGLLGGMGNYRKGLDILIEAIALVLNRDITVHVGGDGKLLPLFRKQAEERGVSDLLVFHGGVPADKTPEFYSMLDCFVLPSRDETFGVVVIEAMASGLPVIATDCGGPREIITPETGILIKKDDPVGLAAAIDYIQENLEKYNRKAIRSYVEEKYSPEAFIRTLSSVYREVLERGLSNAK
ncbi:MAG TPA: glycosyltransferase, partial [Bacteroidales bacterium]|nr:glycosyltransferase [Bacteroidales bacterium]